MERQKYPRKIHTKKSGLCSDFGICEAFNEFFASLYRKDNRSLNVSSENSFPGIHLSDIFVLQSKILNELIKCKSEKFPLMVNLQTY